MRSTTRIFTLEQANRTLPLVRRIVKDIVRADQRICDLYGRWRKLADDGDGARADDLEAEIRAILDAKEEFVRELEQIGCELKDMQRGLVDFPAQRGDRVVYLCWRLGEPEIRYWHEIEAGYVGRRPIDDAFRCRAGEPGGSADEWAESW